MTMLQHPVDVDGVVASGWFEDGANVVHYELLGKSDCSSKLRKLGDGLYARQWLSVTILSPFFWFLANLTFTVGKRKVNNVTNRQECLISVVPKQYHIYPFFVHLSDCKSINLFWDHDYHSQVVVPPLTRVAAALARHLHKKSDRLMCPLHVELVHQDSIVTTAQQRVNFVLRPPSAAAAGSGWIWSAAGPYVCQKFFPFAKRRKKKRKLFYIVYVSGEKH